MTWDQHQHCDLDNYLCTGAAPCNGTPRDEPFAFGLPGTPCWKSVASGQSFHAYRLPRANNDVDVPDGAVNVKVVPSADNVGVAGSHWYGLTLRAASELAQRSSNPEQFTAAMVPPLFMPTGHTADDEPLVGCTGVGFGVAPIISFLLLRLFMLSNVTVMLQPVPLRCTPWCSVSS